MFRRTWKVRPLTVVCPLLARIDSWCGPAEIDVPTVTPVIDVLFDAQGEDVVSGTRQTERIAALGTRWPTLFAEAVGKALSAVDNGEAMKIGRFVVSTHTMALAHQLDQWLERGGLTAEGTADQIRNAEPVALPRRLMQRNMR